jgi:ribosomal protein L37AE/L43A
MYNAETSVVTEMKVKEAKRPADGRWRGREGVERWIQKDCSFDLEGRAWFRWTKKTQLRKRRVVESREGVERWTQKDCSFDLEGWAWLRWTKNAQLRKRRVVESREGVQRWTQKDCSFDLEGRAWLRWTKKAQLRKRRVVLGFQGEGRTGCSKGLDTQNVEWFTVVTRSGVWKVYRDGPKRMNGIWIE